MAPIIGLGRQIRPLDRDPRIGRHARLEACSADDSANGGRRRRCTATAGETGNLVDDPRRDVEVAG